MRSDPAAPQRAKKSFAERLREDRERREKQSEGWGGILSLAMFTVFIVGIAWIEFYGFGLEPVSFIDRNWPPDPQTGKYYRWVGWGVLVLGIWTALGTLWRLGREGMSASQFLKSLWVAGAIVAGGLLFHALGYQFDRWYAIHGEMTQDEIKAAPAWTEPGLPSLDELF